jgi:hypothetical protein
MKSNFGDESTPEGLDGMRGKDFIDRGGIILYSPKGMGFGGNSL